MFAQTVVVRETPKGTRITSYIYTDPSYSELQTRDAGYRSMPSFRDSRMINTQLYPSGTEHSSTNRFNCHGYALLYAQYGYDGVLDNQAAKTFFDDGSYVKVYYETYPGIIVYKRNNEYYHTGLTTRAKDWVISKWANGPLVEHRIENAYEYSTNSNIREFYVRNIVDGPLQIRVGDMVEYSVGKPQEYQSDLQWAVSDPSVFNMVSRGKKMTGYALKTGTVMVRATLELIEHRPTGDYIRTFPIIKTVTVLPALRSQYNISQIRNSNIISISIDKSDEASLSVKSGNAKINYEIYNQLNGVLANKEIYIIRLIVDKDNIQTQKIVIK